MIKKIFKFFKKNLKKSQLILFIVGIVLVLTGIISWDKYFSKFYIFNKQEKYLLETVKDYYNFHSVYLPKENNIKTLTLENLYEMSQIDTINVPKNNKLCDTNSWVKVYNDGNTYHYYVYLKCGKYESSTDHEGPVITLNGDSTIYVSLNKEYEELGVTKVVDNIDGNIDINKVIIDSSKVNTKKVGEYEVTYTIRDTLNNETKVIRKVIVAKNLTDIVKENTNDTNYYQGMVTNNYLLFSGMMYRIINVNDDGTVKLISNENLNNLRYDSATYENSNVDLYLSEEYLNIIHDQSYLVDTEFCVDSIDDLNDSSKNCNIKLKRKVAILDISSFQNSFLNNKSYLCSSFNYLISSKVGNSVVKIGNNSNGCLTTDSNNYLYSIRPVITLKANLNVISGNGTQNNPYKLNDYSYGKQQDKINTRLIGEYVNYSGNIYRIMNIDDDKNVTLISIDGISKKVSGLTGNQFLTASVSNDKKFVFNLIDNDNPGYILNNEFIDYINEKSIITKDYIIPTNVRGINYNKYSSKKVSSKLALPKTYDLFSGKQLSSIGFLYLYIDESTAEDKVFFMNVNTGDIYEDTRNKYGEYCLKTVMTINGNLLIKDGKGTVTDPYYIRER